MAVARDAFHKPLSILSDEEYGDLHTQIALMILEGEEAKARLKTS